MKSTVCTSAVLSFNLYTPASSPEAIPTRTFSFAGTLKLLITSYRSAGPIFEAQPEPDTDSVKRSLFNLSILQLLSINTFSGITKKKSRSFFNSKTLI